MKLEEKKKTKKLEEIKNMSLCSIILGLIVFIIGLLFLPICLVTYKRVTTFDYDSFEAILFYLCVSIGLVLIILGTTLFIKTKINIKKVSVSCKNESNKIGETN